MSRADAIARAQEYFDSGAFKADLSRRVAIPTESQNPERAGELARYVEAEMKPALEALSFRCQVLRHAKARRPSEHGILAPPVLPGAVLLPRALASTAKLTRVWTGDGRGSNNSVGGYPNRSQF